MTLPTARTIPPGIVYEAKGGPWVDYLERYPDMAAPEQATAELTPSRWEMAFQADSHFNTCMAYEPESLDHWTDQTDAGDCEDFALSKRRWLRQTPEMKPHLWWPLGSLRIMVGKQYGWWDRKGQCHAVLNLVTDRGDFIANIPPFSYEILPIEKAMAGSTRFEPWWRTADGKNVEMLIGALKRAS